MATRKSAQIAAKAFVAFNKCTYIAFYFLDTTFISEYQKSYLKWWIGRITCCLTERADLLSTLGKLQQMLALDLPNTTLEIPLSIQKVKLFNMYHQQTSRTTYGNFLFPIRMIRNLTSAHYPFENKVEEITSGDFQYSITRRINKNPNAMKIGLPFRVTD